MFGPRVKGHEGKVLGAADVCCDCVLEVMFMVGFVGFKGLGFRGQSLGLKLGFRVQDSWFRIQSLGFKV